jgi:hypothetical protein
VIDAGTSAEVALAAAIRDHLTERGVAPKFQASAIKGANGLVGLYDLVESIGGAPAVSRARVAHRLAAKRNDAAHSGAEPTRSETVEAIEIASTLVEGARPLPQPRRRATRR